MTEELKPLPCPFCGGKASAEIGLNNFSDAEVVCDLCGASGGLHDSSGGLENDDALAAENKDAAIKAWNTRPSPWNPNMEDAPKSGDVLIMDNHGFVQRMHRINKFGGADYSRVWALYQHNKPLFDDDDCWCWMPLPQPPEESNE